MDPQAIEAAREKLKAKFASSGARIGGKGTVRRKKTAVHKVAAVDDKKLQGTLKRLGVTPITGIEEVNIFKEDNSIIHFASPKVQGNVASNTYVVTGAAETKSVQDLLPGIVMQMGAQGMKALTDQIAKSGGKGLPPGLMAAAQAAAAGGAGGAAAGGVDDEDSPPNLEGDKDKDKDELPPLDENESF